MAADAQRAALAAAAEAEHGRKLARHEPTEPLAALARAEIDHQVALARVNEMQATAAAKPAAAERGEMLTAPPPAGSSGPRPGLSAPKPACLLLPARPSTDRLIATMKNHKQRRAARELGHTTGPPPPNSTPSKRRNTCSAPPKAPPPTGNAHA